MSSEKQKSSVERWSEVANIGAGHAASALAIITGRSVWMAPPCVEAMDEPLEPGWECGAVFSLDGPPGGELAVLLPDQKTLAEVLDMPESIRDSEILRSGLSELGNILVSHAVGAMAEAVGGVALPSPPEPALDRASEVLRAALAKRPRRGSVRISSELHDEAGSLRALLIFVPDRAAEGDGGAG